MSYRIGVDIGGSFTDFVAFEEETGVLHTLKVFSRPDAPGEEVVAGLKGLGERFGLKPADVTHFTHGTTVGVNAVIMRRGPKLALLATQGFRDVLELARLRMPDAFNIFCRRAEPLIERDMVFSVPGRFDANGNELTPLDEAATAAAVREAIDAGAEGLVISFLHSYRSSAHERRAAEIAREIVPDLPIVTSSGVWPIIREYERTATAAINAYVQPRMAHYLASLQKALAGMGVGAELQITKSNGGVMSAKQAMTDCAQVVLSGTASGVIGAAYVARLCGVRDCLSLDVGGTSADLALIIDGKPEYNTGELLGDLEIFMPTVSVTSIGKGGGSVASVDAHGILSVGPESVGSTPGPICYGRGGTKVTITDAFVVNGWIGHSALGYDAVKVDRDASFAAMKVLADQIGMSVNDCASAIIDIAVSGMYSGVSSVVSRYGIDPRSFSLLGFGGAGPMISCFVAASLGIRHVIIPSTPGVLSALGGLVTDLKNDFIRTTYVDLATEALPLIRQAVAELMASGETWLREGQGYTGEMSVQLSGEMRYRGQSFEIDTALDPEWIETGDLSACAAAFHAHHARLFGHSDPEAPVQLVSLRLQAIGERPRPELARIAAGTGKVEPQRLVKVWLDGQEIEIPLYLRSGLLSGDRFEGPAIVAQPDTTTAIPPGFSVEIDDFGTMHVKMSGDTQ
jgi:N-methylhydantoinase A